MATAAYAVMHIVRGMWNRVLISRFRAHIRHARLAQMGSVASGMATSGHRRSCRQLLCAYVNVCYEDCCNHKVLTQFR